MKSRARVLVVDDEPLMRKMVRRILVGNGYCVEAAADAADAIGKIGRSDFDIVITDLRMPEVDGLKLLAQIKQQWPDLGVIVMTGFGDARTADKARARGADEYITKPFSAREIEVIVERVCWRRMVLQGMTNAAPVSDSPDDLSAPFKQRRSTKTPTVASTPTP